MDNRMRRDVGFPYVFDDVLDNDNMDTYKKIQEYNLISCYDKEEINRYIHLIIKKCGENCIIKQPFICEYGYNIEIGNDFFADRGCTIDDSANVNIGHNVTLGFNVSIVTSGLPIHCSTRSLGYRYSLPVCIKDNVWIGAGSIILPAVTIHSNSVIGAGSVVTKDIPGNVVAVGNPCRVLRKITPEEAKYYYRDCEYDAEAIQQINEKASHS